MADIIRFNPIAVPDLSRATQLAIQTQAGSNPFSIFGGLADATSQFVKDRQAEFDWQKALADRQDEINAANQALEAPLMLSNPEFRAEYERQRALGTKGPEQMNAFRQWVAEHVPTTGARTAFMNAINQALKDADTSRESAAKVKQANATAENLASEARLRNYELNSGLFKAGKEADIRYKNAESSRVEQATAEAERNFGKIQEQDAANKAWQQMDTATRARIATAAMNPATQVQAIEEFKRASGLNFSLVQEKEFMDLFTKGLIEGDKSTYDKAEAALKQLQERRVKWNKNKFLAGNLSPEDWTSGKIDLSEYDSFMGATSEATKQGIKNDLAKSALNLISRADAELPDGINLPAHIKAKLIVASLENIKDNIIPEWLKIGNGKERLFDGNAVNWNMFRNLAEKAAQDYALYQDDIERYQDNGRIDLQLQNAGVSVQQQRKQYSPYAINERGSYEQAPTAQNILNRAMGLINIDPTKVSDAEKEYYEGLNRALLFGDNLPLYSVAAARERAKKNKNTSKSIPTAQNSTDQASAKEMQDAMTSAGWRPSNRDFQKMSPQQRAWLKQSKNTPNVVKQDITIFEQNETRKENQIKFQKQLNDMSVQNVITNSTSIIQNIRKLPSVEQRKEAINILRKRIQIKPGEANKISSRERQMRLALKSLLDYELASPENN